MELEQARDILRAILVTGDPRIKKADTQARALGLTGRWRICDIMRHVQIDAAEVIGCRVDDLDLTRSYHVKVMTDVMIHMAEEEIAAATGSLKSSQSCYLQKAL
jgi:hypothetical protein